MGPPPLNSPCQESPHPSPATKLPGLVFLRATAASRVPSPVLEPTLTAIGKMCVFQVSKYCHLPESSMASPFGGGVVYCSCLLCNRVHVASHSNRSIGWVRGILQAQLASANQTYLCCSFAFSQTRKPFPAFISSLHCFSVLMSLPAATHKALTFFSAIHSLKL